MGLIIEHTTYTELIMQPLYSEPPTATHTLLVTFRYTNQQLGNTFLMPLISRLVLVVVLSRYSFPAFHFIWQEKLEYRTMLFCK